MANVTTKVFKSGRGKKKRSESYDGKIQRPLAGFERRGRGKEFGQPLETGKSEKTDSSLVPSERNAPQRFQPSETHVRLLTFRTNGKIIKSYYLGHQIRGNLLKLQIEN